MAAIPLDPDLTATIIAEWRTGEYSQQDLADRHEVSKGAVNKLCKGVEQDVTAIVTAGVQYQSGLAEQDDRMVTAIEDVVDEKTKHLVWLNKAAMKNVSEAMKLDCSNQFDHKTRADTILKTKETIAGKTPDTLINNVAPLAIQIVRFSDAHQQD